MTPAEDSTATTTHADTAGPATRRPLSRPARWALLALAATCLLLGVIGVVVPGLPTTPFILLAAWAAARSSPRLHAWLLQHRLFGPMVRDWQNGGTVSRRAKWSATIAMGVCAAIIGVQQPHSRQREIFTGLVISIL